MFLIDLIIWIILGLIAGTFVTKAPFIVIPLIIVGVVLISTGFTFTGLFEKK